MSSSSDSRAPVMPTSDIAVRSLLRAAMEPVCMFGETALHRRARLEAYWRINGSSLPTTVLEALKIIVSCGNAAIDFRGRRLGGVVLSDESSANASRSVKIADTFGKAPQVVVEFRKALVESTLERAKGRMMLLRQEFLAQRPLVAFTKASIEGSGVDGVGKFLRSTPALHSKASSSNSPSITTTFHQSGTSNTDAVEGGDVVLEANGAAILPIAAASDALRVVTKRELALYVHTATVKPPPTVSSMGQLLRSSVTVVSVVPHAIVYKLFPNFAQLKTSTVVATGHEDGRVWFWDTASMSLLNGPTGGESPSCVLAGVPAEGEVVPFRNRVTSLAFHPLHPLLLVTRRLPEVEVYSLHQTVHSPPASNATAEATPQQQQQHGVRAEMVGLMSKHVGVVHRVRIDPTGSYAVTTSDDMTIGVWDVREAAKKAAGIVAEVDEEDGNGEVAEAVVSGGVPTLLYLQDGHNASSKRNSVFEVSFHPDGSLFTTTDFAGFAMTWDARTSRRVFQGAVVHTGRCTAVDWTPSGQHYATGGDDGLIHIYDVSASIKAADDTPVSKKDLPPRPLLRTIPAHRDTITALEFERTHTHLPVYGQRVTGPQGPEGLRTNVYPRWLMSASVDGAVKVWCTGSGALLRLLHGAGAAPSRYGLGGGSSIAARVAIHIPQYDPAQGSHRGATGKALLDFLNTHPPSTEGMPNTCLRSIEYLPKIITCDHGHGWKMWEATAGAMGVHRSVDIAATTTTKAEEEVVEAADVPVAPTAAVGGGSGSDSDDEMAKLRNKKRRVEAVPAQAPVAPPPPPPTAAAESDSDDEMAALRRKKGK